MGLELVGPCCLGFIGWLRGSEDQYLTLVCLRRASGGLWGHSCDVSPWPGLGPAGSGRCNHPPPATRPPGPLLCAGPSLRDRAHRACVSQSSHPRDGVGGQCSPVTRGPGPAEAGRASRGVLSRSGGRGRGRGCPGGLRVPWPGAGHCVGRAAGGRKGPGWWWTLSLLPGGFGTSALF